jgi:ABC-type sugar transport system ATPase subunit
VIDRLAADGCGILLISSEIEEAMAMCDRILVMNRGEIIGAFPLLQFDREAIMRTAFRAGGAAA